MLFLTVENRWKDGRPAYRLTDEVYPSWTNDVRYDFSPRKYKKDYDTNFFSYWSQAANYSYIRLKQMIEIKNVTKIYNSVCNATKTVALQNVSCSIKNGEFIGIVGRSGSGKSTLLNLLAAIDAPTEGQILYDGVDIANYSEDERAHFRNVNTGFVFQSFYLEANFTVLENIVIPLIIKGVERRIREAEGRELLSEFGLAEKENSFPKELSGGEMQRVSLCRALINKPQL